MRHCFTRALRGRQPIIVALLLLTSPLAAAGAIASCADGPLPTYPVPATNLQLIPEQSTVDPAGDSIYVLLELQRPADAGATDAASARPIVVYVRAQGATAEALPGPSLCTDLDGGVASGADGGAVQAGLTIPDIAFLTGRDPASA